MSIPFGYHFSCWFRVIRASSVLYGVFIPEEVYGVGDKVSGDTDTLGGHFEHAPEICPFH
jgi:hypothetical protein